MPDRTSQKQDRALNREILLAFWKVHILAHACDMPVYGQWMLEELRHHGYHVSPGTLYPIFRRMEQLGWLEPAAEEQRNNSGRQLYRITPLGREILRKVRHQLNELISEMPESM